jgi:hypothetical protein
VIARLAAVLMAGVIAARCLSRVLPEVWFDVDPVLDPDPGVGLSPTVVMWLDVAVVLLAATVLAAEAARRRGGDLLLVALWALPLGVVVLWALRGTHHAQIGVPWLAGTTAAVALAHACRDAAARRAVLAVLIAISGPLVLQGFVQWGWTIPETLTWFQAHREAALASLGMEPGSPAAQVYERRLIDGGASGWFSSPNLLGGVLAGCAVVWLGLFIGASRRNASAVLGGVLLVAAAAAAAVVGLAGSVGGLVALAIGLALLAAGTRGLIGRVWARRLAVLIPLCAAAAPIAAALIGPAALDVPGGRSLAIRGQYVDGTVGVIASAPATGVGPAGFQDAWMRNRPPGAPEEITSAHAMTLDWWAAGGLALLAWVALAWVLVWRCGDRVEVIEDDETTAGVGWAVLGAACAAILSAVWACGAWSTMDAGAQMVRVLGVCLLPVLAGAAAWSMRGASARWGVAAAAMLLLAHAQVEMLLHNPATVVWVLAMLGAAAAARGPGRPVWAGAAAACGAAVAVFLGAVVVPRVSARDAAAESAARLLIDAPGRAGAAADAQVRMQAAAMLQEAAWSAHDPRLLVAAADQFLAAARPLPASHPVSVACLSGAAAAGELAFTQGSTAGAWHWLEAVGRTSPLDTVELLDLAEAITRADPSSPMAWVTLAQARERAGLQTAAAAWRRALELDDANVIDPLQRLAPPIRARAISGAAAPPPQP